MRLIYRRHFDGLSRSVYLLRYYSRIARGNAVESSLTKEIIALMDEVNENLKKKITVAEQILAKSNVKVTKTEFDKVNVTIIDPLANRFLQSINIAQELDQKLSALWLACVLDDEQRTKATQEIENELRGIQGKCRAISIGLRDRVRAQRTPIDASSGIDIIEAETKEDEAAELELGETAESAEKTTTGRKPRKSSKEDAVSVELDTDNTEDIKSSEVIEEEIAA
jgi:RNAse (barnase) inhibitor barstar